MSHDHAVGEAERLIREAGRVLEMPTDSEKLKSLRKGNERKVLLAALLRRRTSVDVNRIAERLALGHPGSVSRLIGGIERDVNLKRKLDELEKMLDCGNPIS